MNSVQQPKKLSKIYDSKNYPDYAGKKMEMYANIVTQRSNRSNGRRQSSSRISQHD